MTHDTETLALLASAVEEFGGLQIRVEILVDGQRLRGRIGRRAEFVATIDKEWERLLAGISASSKNWMTHQALGEYHGALLAKTVQSPDAGESLYFVEGVNASGDRDAEGTAERIWSLRLADVAGWAIV